MVTWVLDTSVVAKWFLSESGTDRAEKYLKALDGGAARVVVPSSLYYELGNIFWVRRRDRLTEQIALQMWLELLELPLDVTDWHELLPQSISSAYRLGITTYDAVFVVLAQQLGCDFITDDQALWKNTRSACPWVKRL